MAESESIIEQRVVQRVKGGETFVFRYGPGGEQQVIDEMMALAQDPHSRFDWYDAAVLSFHVAAAAAGMQIESRS